MHMFTRVVYANSTHDDKGLRNKLFFFTLKRYTIFSVPAYLKQSATKLNIQKGSTSNTF